MHLVSMAEAQAHLPELIHEVIAGGEVIITDPQQPDLRMGIINKNIEAQKSINKKRRQEILTRIDKLRESLPKLDIPSVDIIRQMRDERLQKILSDIDELRSSMPKSKISGTEILQQLRDESL